MAEDAVQDNANEHRFEMHCEDTTAFLVYAKSPGSLRLIHTEVPPQLKGKGIGSKLVDAALKIASESVLEVIPECPFAVQYLKRHPEYANLVQPSTAASFSHRGARRTAAPTIQPDESNAKEQARIAMSSN